MNSTPFPSPATLARIAWARNAQFTRYLGYRALGYSPACAYLLSIRPL